MAKIQLEATWFLIAILIIICFIAVIYVVYVYGKTDSFNDIWMFLKVIFLVIFINLFLLLFAIEVIIIYITLGTETGSESWIFVLLNSILLGIYLNVCGLKFGSNKNEIMKYTILFVLVYIAVSGFGYLGVLVEFREPISDYLNYRFIQTNSTIAIEFIIWNIVLFILIYFISFMVEKEK